MYATFNVRNYCDKVHSDKIILRLCMIVAGPCVFYLNNASYQRMLIYLLFSFHQASSHSSIM